MDQALKKVLVAAGLAAVLTGLSACETATPYQPLSPAHAGAGGYSDHQIEATRFQVAFNGNAVTSRETVERYLLFRAAELTLAQGYDWFEAEGRSTDKKTETYTAMAPDPWGCGYGPGWCSGYWGPRWRFYRRGAWGSWDPWMHQPLEVHEITRFSASAEIVMGKGTKPAGNRHAFDARDVLQHLSADIQRPKV